MLSNLVNNLKIRTKLLLVFAIFVLSTSLLLVTSFLKSVRLTRISTSLALTTEFEKLYTQQEKGLWQMIGAQQEGAQEFITAEHRLIELRAELEKSGVLVSKEIEQSLKKASVIRDFAQVDGRTPLAEATQSGIFKAYLGAKTGFIDKNNKHIQRLSAYRANWVIPRSAKDQKIALILDKIKAERTLMESYHPEKPNESEIVTIFRATNDEVVAELVQLWVEEIKMAQTRASTPELRFMLIELEKVVSEITATTFPRISPRQAEILGITASDSVRRGAAAEMATTELTDVCDGTLSNWEERTRRQLWRRATVPEVGDNVTPFMTLGKVVSCQQGLRVNAEDQFSIQKEFVTDIEPTLHQIISELAALRSELSHNLKQQVEVVGMFEIIFAILLVASGGFLLFKIANSIIFSLTKAKQIASDITRGQLAESADIYDSDEVGDLSLSLRSMAEELKVSEGQVRENEQKLMLTLEEMKRKNQLLEDSKKAMLNIVEDLEVTKNKVEREKAKDDAIITSIGEGLVLTDEVGRVQFINQAAAKMMGYELSELINLQLTDKIAFEDEKGMLLASEQWPIPKVLRERRRLIQNLVITRKDGTKFVAALTVTPVIEGDDIIGAISVFRDVTKEREVDRMKTEFISLASHQLRTPLSAIRWFTEMLVNGDAGQLTSEQLDMAKNINDSTERMIALVGALLNISRIESGRIIVDPQPTDIKKLIEGVIKELELKLKEKNIQLIIGVHDHLPEINLDPKLIREVYVNLLTNAIKYTPAGGEIEVQVSHKNDELISRISDTGYGIPPEEQGKVFQKFYRGNNIIKVETEGNGLGLYLVRAIIESSKGKIWFESQVNKGTTFWFTLPMTGMTPRKGEVTLNS